MKMPCKFTHTIFGLCLTLSLTAQTTQTRQPQRQPGDAEFAAAKNITDTQAQIKEFKRIKAAYPNSELNYEIDRSLLNLVTKNADTFDKLLAAQRDVIDSSKINGRFFLYMDATNLMLNHSKIAEFPKADVLKTVQDYKAQAIPLLNTSEAFERKSGDTSETTLRNYSYWFEIPLTRALVMNGKGQEALLVLEEYGKTITPSADYYMALGDVYQELKRDREALDAYMEAAVARNPAAMAKARTLYTELNGPDANFGTALVERRTHRPFNPPPFKAPESWKGKTVLAEVFTGSECTPCVAAAFAFDALEETYPTQYLAVLKYHLPIPAYDPMMNPATKKRSDYYGRKIITGTPSVILDGVKKPSVGGSRFASQSSFYNAKQAIDALMSAEAGITIKAIARLSGDNVKVDCEFSKVIGNAEYNVVLVQTEEEFMGGNGLAYHNMVVRDMKTTAPSKKASVTFNIVESEKAADAHLAEWAAKASERVRQGSKWPAKRNKIDRNKLKAVIFVQDKKTKRVYNAFVADVPAQQI